VEHFKQQKVGLGLHICGYTEPILEDMVSTGVTNVSIDAPTGLGKAIEATRGKAVLIGNINPNLFFTGTRDEVEQAIEECTSLAPEDSGYILASGCEVPGNAPPEKIDWFVELANGLGRHR
jgi:uroporphyrinogen-III decarboxylase